MKSTLYLKFILLYIILGFLSIFTVASLSSTLTTHYLESSISGNMYQSANLLASNYLPDYFSKTIALADVYTQLKGRSRLSEFRYLVLLIMRDLYLHLPNPAMYRMPLPGLKILILQNLAAPLI